MPRMVLEEVDGPRQSWPLRPGSNGVGRAPDNSVRINRDNVSRHHAEVLLLPTEHGMRGFLKDLGSSNGSFINGQAVALAELADGDLLQFGSTRCRFEASETATADNPWRP